MHIYTHLEIAEYGDEQDKYDEAHAAADYQSESPREYASPGIVGSLVAVHGRAVTAGHSIGQLESQRFGAARCRGVRVDVGQRGLLEHDLVVRAVETRSQLFASVS